MYVTGCGVAVARERNFSVGARSTKKPTEFASSLWPAKHKADGGVRRQSDNLQLGCAPSMTASPKVVQAQTCRRAAQTFPASLNLRARCSVADCAAHDFETMHDTPYF